jgi:hypothetical protein
MSCFPENITRIMNKSFLVDEDPLGGSTDKERKGRFSFLVISG